MFGISKTKWKNQFFLYENASDFHNNLKEIFCTDTYFKQIQCFQEVPVNNLVENYDSPLEAVDWYIESLNVVIELHGEQHYKMTSFGNTSFNQKKINFNNIKYRDNKKKTALINSGFNFIEISYKDKNKMNAEFIKNLIFNYGEKNG